MNKDEKFKLITRGLQEIVGEKELKEILAKRDLNIYWGTAPHMGYYVPILKIGDFLRAGQNVTILFADIHAVLDNLKSTFKIVEKRTKYYELVIREMLRSVNVPLDKLKFVRGSSFQLSKEYTLDMYKLASITSLSKAKHSGADVVKQNKDPLLSGLLYPLLQALDEQFLHVDAQFGGVDQRKIFMLAREFLPKLGYSKRIHLMNPLIPGLTKSGKMSSSIENSKIDFFDSDEVIRKKFKKSYSEDGVVEGNCLLAILRNILMDLIVMQKRKFIVKNEKDGSQKEYASIAEIEKDFLEKTLKSGDLKGAVAEEIIRMITPLRNVLKKNQNIYDEAYPEKKVVEGSGSSPNDGVKKKVEKKKNEKKSKKQMKKEKKKKVGGYGMFMRKWVEDKKGDYPNIKKRKLLEKQIARDFKVGQMWGKLPKEEKEIWEKKALEEAEKK